MQTRKQTPLALLTVFAVGLTSAALAQNPPESEKTAPIRLRVLCGQPAADSAEIKFIQGETALAGLTLQPSMVSDPFAIGSGEIIVSRKTADAQAIDPILKFTIPAVGSRFALALFPAPEGDPKNPYRHILIRTDGLRFGASDLYLFNFSGIPVGGSLGKRSFTLAPGKSQVVTPDPDADEGRMYQARFYIPHDGDKRIFSDTRWPVSPSARIYLFFIPDPARQSITYLSFREYAPFE